MVQSGKRPEPDQRRTKKKRLIFESSSLKLIEERLLSLQKSKEELVLAKKNLDKP